MPPSSFFGSLGTHGTSPRSFLNFADDTRFPAAFRVALSLIGLGSQKVGATVGTTAAPDKRRQLRGKRGDVLTASTTKTHRLQQRSRGCRVRAI
jgi:hypothetical protein